MKKVSILLLSVLFIISLNSDLFARGGSSSSSPSSYSSSSRSYSSSSYSSSSRSVSSSPSSSPSKSFSGSGSRSQSQNFSGSGSRSQSQKFSGSSNVSNRPTQKTQYDTSAKVSLSHESSKSKFYAYNMKDKPSVSGRPITNETRNERMQSVYVAYKPSGYYTPRPNTTIIYRDNYSNNFLQYATMIWLFHHWDTVDKSRFDKQRLSQLELEVARMKSQGVKQDSGYVQPGVDRDLQFQNVSYDKPIQAKPEDDGLGFFGWLGLIIGIILLCIAGWLIYKYLRGDYRSR